VSEAVNPRRVGAGYALLAAAMFGLSAPLAKRVLAAGVGQLALAGLLYAGAAIGVSLILLVRPRGAGDAPLGRGDLAYLLVASLAGGVLGPILLMLGFARTSGMAAALLLSVELPMTATIAALFLREAITARLVAGGVLVIGGTLLLGWDGSAGTTTAAGTAAIALACLAWAIDNNVTAKVAGRDALRIARFKCALAAPITLAIAAALEPASLSPERLPPRALALALVTGLFGYGLSIACFVRALRALGAARTGALFATAPFFGAFLTLPILGERPTLMIAAAAPILAVGTFLVAWDPKAAT
jgi:drug/metabolite transporter (DMT)-like permease